MTIKENYQRYLDAAYCFAPFTYKRLIDTHDPRNIHLPYQCQVCSNKHVRYLCECSDRTGTLWYIGRNCETELSNRQFREKLHGNT